MSGCDFIASHAPWLGLGAYGSPAPAFEPVPEAFLLSPPPQTATAVEGVKGALPQILKTLEGHEDHVTGLAFSPDGRLLVSASYGDFTIRLWSVADGRELSVAKSQGRPTGMALSPDGALLITTDAGGAITFWPLEGDRLGAPQSIDAGIGHVGSVAVSPNGMLFATASFDKIVLIGNVVGRTLIRRVDTPEPMRGVAFSPSGDTLAAGSNANTFTLWKLKDGSGKTYTIRKVDKASDVGTLAFSPGGDLLATGHMDSSITVWDLRRVRERHNYFVGGASTWQVSYSPDGKVLATAQQNGGLYLWDSRTAAPLGVLRGHSGAVRAVAFSPDGTTIATGGEDKKIIIWR